MNIGTSFIIFLLAIIAFGVEFALYFVFGFGTALTGGERAILSTTTFFFKLMLFTVVVGISAPLSAIVGSFVRSSRISTVIFLLIVLVSFTLLVIF